MKKGFRSMNHIQVKQIIKKYCLSDDLSTYDPYDIWKTGIGIRVKNLFNTNRLLGALPALCLTLYDLFVNNRWRWGYQKQEYPIVRALAAQILLNEYKQTNDKKLLSAVEKHFEWLKNNISHGYSGACWGLGFRWAAFKSVIYDANIPFTTHTPYVLEALFKFTQQTGDSRYKDLIESCFRYYENDVCIIYEDKEKMAVSYGPFKDRITINASSYTLYAYSIFIDYFPEQRDYILDKILKLFRFIVEYQREDGSWFYSPDDKNSFIDCFHSCIIVKNLLKASYRVKIAGIDTILEKGYKYIISQFFTYKYGLYKRYTKSNILSIIKFDLYDNAEVLNLANLMGDKQLVKDLEIAINYFFVDDKNIYSRIDYLGIQRYKNTLRWAVMPYLFALSGLE
jgi:hypothetical protein